MTKFKQRDIEELLTLLNPETPEDEEKLIKTLSELFGVPADEQRERERYAGVAAVVKECYGDRGYCRFAGSYLKMRTLPFYQERQARVKLVNTMHQRQSGRHQLSEFAGGPGQAEGGPISPVVVGKEIADDVRRRLERAIVDATAEVKLSPVLKVLVSPRGDFYRLEYAGEAGPEGYARFGAFPIWAVETHDIGHAVELAVRGLAMGKIAKENKGRHPLADFAGAWEGSAGESVQT